MSSAAGLDVGRWGALLDQQHTSRGALLDQRPNRRGARLAQQQSL